MNCVPWWQKIRFLQNNNSWGFGHSKPIMKHNFFHLKRSGHLTLKEVTSTIIARSQVQNIKIPKNLWNYPNILSYHLKNVLVFFAWQLKYGIIYLWFEFVYFWTKTGTCSVWAFLNITFLNFLLLADVWCICPFSL